MTFIIGRRQGSCDTGLALILNVYRVWCCQVIQEDGDGGKVVVCRKKTEVGHGSVHSESCRMAVLLIRRLGISAVACIGQVMKIKSKLKLQQLVTS